MKTLFIILFCVIGCSCFANDSVYKTRVRPCSDTTVLPQILSLSLNTFIGKPVDSLFLALPVGYTKRGFMPVSAGYTKGVYQSYSTSNDNNCFIEIYIDTFNFLPIPNLSPTTTWNMSLARQETIAFIKVIKNNKVCVYGCNNPNYYD